MLLDVLDSDCANELLSSGVVTALTSVSVGTQVLASGSGSGTFLQLDSLQPSFLRLHCLSTMGTSCFHLLSLTKSLSSSVKGMEFFPWEARTVSNSSVSSRAKYYIMCAYELYVVTFYNCKSYGKVSTRLLIEDTDVDQTKFYMVQLHSKFDK